MRVIIYTESGDFHGYQVDLHEQLNRYEDLITNGSNPHLEDRPAQDYFADGMFPKEVLSDLNGKHFLFGWAEAIWQSPDRPPVSSGNVDYFEVEYEPGDEHQLELFDQGRGIEA